MFRCSVKAWALPTAWDTGAVVDLAPSWEILIFLSVFAHLYTGAVVDLAPSWEILIFFGKF